MHGRSWLHLLVALAALLLASSPTVAGGGGLPAVELDAPPPGEVIAGEVVTVGFMVLSHGSPFPDARAYLSALHQETKETFRADAVADGEPGHFTAEARFHEPGTWFWEIVLADWDVSTTLAPVRVVAAGAATLDALSPEITLPAAIHAGTCAAPGEASYPLAGLGSGAEASEWVGAAQAQPAKASLTEVEAKLADLLAGDHVLLVTMPDGEPLACGEIGGYLIDGALPFGLRAVDGAKVSGIAIVEDRGGTATVRAYLTTSTAATAATGTSVEVAIAEFVFDPPMLEIATGDTVTWTNQDAIPHTVSFDGMEIADSPPLDQGESFSVTFDTPGTYAYQCNPHPDMRGTVVVT